MFVHPPSPVLETVLGSKTLAATVSDLYPHEPVRYAGATSCRVRGLLSGLAAFGPWHPRSRENSISLSGLDTGWVRRRLLPDGHSGIANPLARLRSILSPTHVCLIVCPSTPQRLWCWQPGSNRRPSTYEIDALPTELCQQKLTNKITLGVFLS